MSDNAAATPQPRLDRAEGALLALAAGDALGWPQEMPRNIQGGLRPQAQLEFRQWTRRSGGRFQPYEEPIDPGDYSDDTQLTLAVARCRTKYATSWWKALTRIEIPLWTLYERGGGGATKRAANAWIEGNPPWKSSRTDQVRRYFNAGGNGVAMRVLPHALFLAQDDTPAALIHDVLLDGSATHGHPRALIGANVYAYAAWLLMRRTATLPFGELLQTLIEEVSVWSRQPESDGQGSWFQVADEATRNSYIDTWDRTTREMRELLETAQRGIHAGAIADERRVLDDLGCFGRTKGAGTSSAAAAVYLAARHAAQPTQGVLRAAFETGADTDTLAAMVGGLAGCIGGVEWLPRPWLCVQDARYIRHLASRLAEGPDHAQRQKVQPIDHPKAVFSQLLTATENQQVDLGNRRVSVTLLPNPKPIGKPRLVRAWRLTTAHGQTLRVNRVEDPPTARSAETNRGRASDLSATNDTVNASDASEYPTDELYDVFRRRLRHLLERSDSLKTKQIQDALGIVPSQAAEWLSRAQQEGWLLQTNKSPKRFALRSNFLV